MDALPLFLAQGSPDWVEVIVVVLLLFGGAIQAIIKRLRGEDEGPPRPRPKPPVADASAGGGGLERWRELERGTVVLEPPPERRAPRPRPARRPPPPPEPEPELAGRHLGEWHSEVGRTPFADAASEEELTRRVDEALPMARAERPAAARTALHPARRLLDRRDAWREAILAAEVLGRPVALRHENELPGRIPG